MKKIIATALILLCITATAFALSLGGAPGIKHHGGVSMGNTGLVTNPPTVEIEIPQGTIDYDGAWTVYESNWGDEYTSLWQ